VSVGGERPFRRRLVVNTAATGAGNLWAMVVALVSLPLVLRGLGPTAFGLWVLLQTFSAVTGWFSLADLGIGTAAVRSIASSASVGDDGRVRSSVGTTLVVFAAMGLVSFALLASLGWPLLPLVFRVPHRLLRSFRLATLIFAGQVAADLLTEGAESCLEGLQRVDASRAVDAYRRTVVAIGVSTAALWSGSLVVVAGASAACSATAVIAGLAAVRGQAGGMGRFDMAEVWALLRYGRTVAVLRPLGVIQRTMDRVIVGVILGPAAVALVEIASQILNAADAVLSATSYAVIPGSAWLGARRDHKSLAELLIRGTKYSVLLTWLVCAAGCGLASPFVRLWVGSRYAHAPTLIAVALAGEAVAAPGQVASSLLIGVGRASRVLRAAAIAIVVNLVTSVALVEAIGTTGTFLGTLLANVVLAPLLLRAAMDEAGIPIGAFIVRALAPPLAPAIGLTLMAWAISKTSIAPAAQLGFGALAVLVALTVAVGAGPSMRSELAEIAAALRRRA